MLWPHTACGCSREPFVGARYRQRSIGAVSGADLGWRHYTVRTVEPLRIDRIFCRRAILLDDDGGIVTVQVQELFRRFEAIDNVLSIAEPTP